MNDSTAAFASAGDMQEQKARVVQLSQNAYGFISDHDPNCGFVVGDNSVLVIDPRATPRMARELKDAISSVTDKPVGYIFLSHYHAVRVLGASVFAPAPIISSRATLSLVRERGQADMDSEIGRFPRLFDGLEEIPGLTPPSITFESELSLWLGDTEVRFVHLGRGHSAGDSICWLPQQDVIFSGDLVENRCGVYMGDAYLQEWPRTLDKLRELDAKTMVPGRGAAMMSRKEISDAIASTQDFISSILHAVRYGLSQGGGLRECYDIAERLLTPVFGDWPIYTHVLAFDVARAYDELRGIEHPRIWTDERDQELWGILHGAKGVPA